MTELSPAAQEVLDAAVLPCTIRQGIAAAIEKLAHQVVPNEPDYMRAAVPSQDWWDKHDLIRDKLLAIAAELRGTDTP